VLRSLHNVYDMIDVPFLISVIAWAIPGRFSGRARDGSFTIGSEVRKREFFFA